MPLSTYSWNVLPFLKRSAVSARVAACVIHCPPGVSFNMQQPTPEGRGLQTLSAPLFSLRAAPQLVQASKVELLEIEALVPGDLLQPAKPTAKFRVCSSEGLFRFDAQVVG